jgi:hypothetical protein
MQLFTSSFTLNTNIVTSTIVIKAHILIFKRIQKLFRIKGSLKLGVD